MAQGKIRQHQPLRIPKGWNDESRQLVIQLESILDDIYARFGRIRMADLGSDLQDAIGSAVTDVSYDSDTQELQQTINGDTEDIVRIATLDGNGKVPASQLPSYVDDVEEYADLAHFPSTGEANKIYVARDTGFTYRWSGTQYVRLNTYDEATQSTSGLMSASDKTKLDGVAPGATANIGTITGINMNGSSKGTSGVVDLGNVKTTQSAVSDPTASGTSATFIDTISQNAQGVITPTKKTVRTASQSQSGLMSASDKTKLDGAAADNAVVHLAGEEDITGTKNLNSGYLRFNPNTAVQYLTFRKSGNNAGWIQFNYGDASKQTTNQFGFIEMSPKSTADASSTGHNEGYYLPPPTVGRSTDAAYRILTARDAVTVAQGGTGATTDAGARTNLGAAADNAVVHLAGTETITGSKSFTANTFIKSTTSPSLLFQGTDLSNVGARVYGAYCETSDGKYNRPQFLFDEYSPSSDGASRTSYYDRFKLPRVAAGKTANNDYDILTTKDNYWAGKNETVWGTSISVDSIQALILVNSNMRIQVWCSSTAGFAVWFERYTSQGTRYEYYKHVSSNTGTFGNSAASGTEFSITRSGSSFTLTYNTSAAMKAVY